MVGSDLALIKYITIFPWIYRGKVAVKFIEVILSWDRYLNQRLAKNYLLERKGLALIGW
jgi:hypothetical protein